jgi:hypothetical protein
MANAGTMPMPGTAPVQDLPLGGVAVFDPSLARGRRLAVDATRRGLLAFRLETDADLGTLWHQRIAPRVADHAVLAVALRPADAFVLARFAAALRCCVIDT